jgi:Tol biopolymer transport system component
LGDAEIFVIDLATGTETRLTNHPGYDSDPHFSPDMSTMLLTREFEGGNIEIATMSPTNGDAGEVVNLTNHPARDQDPAWHPDGSGMVWQSDRDAGDTEIYWMQADGSSPARLTHHAGFDGVPDVRGL